MKHLRGLVDGGILQHEHTLEEVHDFRQIQDQHRHNCVCQRGKGDVAHLLPATGAVNRGGFVDAGINAGQGRHENNRSPAGVMPNIDDVVAETPPVIVTQEVDFLVNQPHLDEHLIDKTCGRGRKQHPEDAGGNDPRHEVRQVDDGLRELLHLRGDHFVEQQRNDDRHEGVQKQLDNGDFQRVGEGRPELWTAEQLLEVCQPGELKRVRDFAGLIPEEGKRNAKHRQVMENDECHKNR